RGEQVFEEEGVVAEGAGGLAAGGGERGGQLLGAVHLVHALPAAARRGFDQQRVSDLGGAAEEGGVVEPGAGEAGHGGHAAGGDGGAGGDLVAHGLDRRGGRADEHQPGRLAGAGEAGPFGEETVAGVHGSGAA